MRTKHALAIVFIAAIAAACTPALTNDEAAAALDEASASGSAASLTATSIDLTTSFTIGMAVDHAAQEIHDYVVSQLPCARVTLTGATLTIEYGALPGTCVFHGHTFHGTHQITVMANDMAQVIVQHTWTSLSDGQTTISGTATVTWSFADPSRRVMHDVTWTRLSDGRTGTGTGDVTQTPLAGSVLVGFQETGSRSWHGARGTWTLESMDVQWRWVDAVPQAGEYLLTTPFGKSASLSFSRTAPSTIHVLLTSGTKSFDFDVTTVP